MSGTMIDLTPAGTRGVDLRTLPHVECALGLDVAGAKFLRRDGGEATVTGSLGEIVGTLRDAGYDAHVRPWMDYDDEAESEGGAS